MTIKVIRIILLSKKKVDKSIIQHLLLHWKDWWNLLERLGDAAGKVLWKIYNQEYLMAY